MASFVVLTRLLQSRWHFLDEVYHQTKLESKIASLLTVSSGCFAVYGATMGAYSGGLQILASAVKLPALYLITLVICLPPLYFFDILFGSKLSFKQYVVMGLMTTSIIGGLLFSFTPMMLFFLLSVEGYNFFLLLNVVVMGLTGAIGVRIFYRGMCDTVDPSIDPIGHLAVELPADRAMEPQRPDNLRHQLLKGWVILYGLIGSQLGWTLSPFVGIRGEAFQFFRSGLDSNFYAEVIRIMFSFGMS